MRQQAYNEVLALLSDHTEALIQHEDHIELCRRDGDGNLVDDSTSTDFNRIIMFL